MPSYHCFDRIDGHLQGERCFVIHRPQGFVQLPPQGR
jgi:hypothetical protein